MTDYIFDKLDALIALSAGALLDDYNKYFESMDTSKVSIGKKLDKKILHIIWKEKHEPIFKTIITISKHVAIVFLIVASVMFTMAMSVDAVRKEFFRVITEWFDDYIAINFESKDTVIPVLITQKKEPAYLGGDYDKVIEVDFPTMYNVIYKTGENRVLTYSQNTFTGSKTLIDSDNCTLNNNIINGYDAVLAEYSDDNRITILFNDGSYEYLLTSYDGYITSEQLIKIAESIENIK
jgi:hypothetical protein